MYEKVFRNAVDLGREQELFGITKDQKETLDTSVAYIQVLGENEVLGNGFWSATNGFFCKLIISFYTSLLKSHFLFCCVIVIVMV